MPKGFSPMLAFGSGLASGIQTTEAAKRLEQNKQDDQYRELALKSHFDIENYAARKKIDDDAQESSYNQIATAAGLNKQNTTNQASFDALKQAQTNPAIAQDTTVTGQDTPPPTNTPQTSVSMQPASQTIQAPGSAPVQGQGQIQQQDVQPNQSPAPQNGMPSTGPQTAVQAPNQSVQQGDATDPLKPPTSQSNDNVNPSGGTTLPNNPDDLVTDALGNRLTREQAARAVAYGTEEAAKLKHAIPADAAYQLGLGRVLKEDHELGSKIKTTGQNSYGFTIGKVADGLVAPTMPETLDQTKRMTQNQASIKMRKDDEQLMKDKDAAINAGRASQEFSYYLSGNESGDTGGLQKIGFIRDFTSALSATDGTLDSVNKSLTFNIVGFERTPGMRLTQAEFFIAREAMPGRGNTPEANKNIAQFWQAKLQLPQEYAHFKQDYIAANGSWNEAIGDRMFQQYQSDNPIFDPKILANPEDAKLSDFKINPNRQSLEQYSKSGGWDKTLKTFGVQVPQTAPGSAPVANQSQQQTAPKNDPMGLFN